MPFLSQKDATQRESIVIDNTPYKMGILWLRNKNQKNLGFVEFLVYAHEDIILSFTDPI